jgi:N-acetylglutamate synthase-like GNAT family acetyltransferase
MQVSYEYRHKGIGKKLFELCIKKAKEMGIKKIYISANSSEETQNFYLSAGCVDAEEIKKELFEKEPYDRHMEYILYGGNV